MKSWFGHFKTLLMIPQENRGVLHKECIAKHLKSDCYRHFTAKVVLLQLVFSKSKNRMSKSAVFTIN